VINYQPISRRERRRRFIITLTMIAVIAGAFAAIVFLGLEG
jgi:hypothetical protein